MIYDNNNYKNISQIGNINLANQISYFDNQYINNNYLISNENKILSKLNNYSIYYSCNNNINNNIMKNQIINYEKINSSIIKKNKINEEIKNFDYNDEYFKNYIIIPKQFNHDNTKNLKFKNKEKNRINSFYDFIFSKKGDKNNIDLVNISPSRNPINNNYLTDKQNIYLYQNNLNYDIKRDYLSYNRSHSKDKEIKVKKQIIKKATNTNLNNNYINENEEINKIPHIPQNDFEPNNFIYSDKKFKRKNHINIIKIPLNIKRYEDKTFDKKSLQTQMQSQIKNSVKKNQTNIDINLDCQIIPSHKKTKSLIFDKKLKNNILEKDEKINNIQIIKKTPEKNTHLISTKSEKNINRKIKIKENKYTDNLNINQIRKEVKDRSHSPTKCKINNPYEIPNLNNIPKDIKIFWGGKSQAGKDSKGNYKINQDAFKVCENINNIKNFNIFILCDGHGPDGHHISKFVTKHIISKFSNYAPISSLKDINQIYKLLTEFNYQIIKNIFSETDKFLSSQRQFDTYISGTTCVLILQLGNKIICANIGDSRAILVFSSRNQYNNYNQINNTKIFPLSLDAKPDLPSEIERIKKCGGEVHKGKNRKGKFVGPMRVFAKGKDYPGLAMSRSLGDFRSKEYGVICEPSFVEYNLDQFCKYIVVCSDGVWDFMENENVMKVANKHYLNLNPDGFCQEILDNASYWWEKEDIVIDDITALIVFFKF